MSLEQGTVRERVVDMGDMLSAMVAQGRLGIKQGRVKQRHMTGVTFQP